MARSCRTKPPRILTFNFHEPYLCLMAKTGLAMDLGLYAQGNLARVWNSAFRSKPDHLTELPEPVWRERLMAGEYDVVIAHNEMNALDIFTAPCAKLLVCHNRYTYIKSTARVDEGDPIQAFNHLLERLADVFGFVFISESKRDDYGIPGRVILPGVDVEEYGGYSGEHPCVIRVGNMIQERNLMFDVPFQEAVCQDLPNRVIGMNPSIAGSAPAASNEALKQCFRENRCMLHVTRQEFEDGYNLSMIEAMASGMPVVSLANRTSPITDGVDGYSSFDVITLRRRLHELLKDRDTARALGQRGRETVARKFAIERFVDAWRSAIFEAVDGNWQSGVSRPRSKPARKRILLDYVASPLTTARYMQWAAEEEHDVLTVGFRIPEPVLQSWGFGADVPPYPPQRISMSFKPSYGDIVSSLPQGYRPDFYLFIDSGPREIEPDINVLPCLKAAYLIDTHITPDIRLAMARYFDIVFLAQKAQVELFRKAGIRRVHWLPLACSPELHRLHGGPRTYDVAFVGSMGGEDDPRRAALLHSVMERFPNHCVGRRWPDDMAQIYAQSKIVINIAVQNDVNMRVFEALASGALLITDEAEGLSDLFTDGVHLVIYRRDEDLPDLIEQYLVDSAARERIAQAGQSKVLSEHTYQHRLRSLVDAVSSTLLEATPAVPCAKPEDYYKCPRRELLPYIPFQSRRVLDVGCGAGAFGYSLKRERAVGEVFGIELVDEAARQAERVLDGVLTGNLEEMTLPFSDGYFDCIICGDVLEHLMEPSGALQKLSRVLDPDGVIVISIPNACFHDVLSSLSNGFWSYCDAGILDATHLRFFTERTLPDMIHGAGLEVVQIRPLNMRDPGQFPRQADGSLRLGKLFMASVSDAEYERFLVYQYVVVARKKDAGGLGAAWRALENHQDEMALSYAEQASGVEEFESGWIMAKALARLGRLDAAEAQYRAILSLREDSAVGGELGILLVAMNRTSEARSLLEEALKADPTQDRIQGALGLVCLSEEKYTEAFSYLYAALEANYSHEMLLGPLILAAEPLGRLAEAEVVVCRFVEFYPGNATIVYLHAEVLVKLGRLIPAREALDFALVIDPQHTQAQDLLRRISSSDTTEAP